jgi:hypothetical protein
LFDVLIAVEWLNGIILAKAPKGIDEVGAEVRVDVLRGELCIPLSEIRKAFSPPFQIILLVLNHL